MSHQENRASSHEALKYHWRVWKYTGIDRPKHISRRWYFCYAIALNTSITILFPLTLFINLLNSTNLQQLCENLTITITDTIANLKFLNVYFVRCNLLKIKNILNYLDRRVRSNEHDDEYLALRNAVHISQNLFRTFGYLYTLGTCLSLIKILVSKERILLYPAWFCVDWIHSDVAYIIVITYQLLALIVQAIQNCASDSYPSAYLCILTGHMRALEIRTRKIGGIWRSDQSLLRLQTVQKHRLEHNYHEIIACIQDHLLILKLHKIVQKIISVACLAQFICSTLVQCTVGLHFLYVADANDLSAQILSIIFFVAVTLEAFVICYFGHFMRQQSEDLTVALYSCNWVDQLPKFKRTLITALLRSQRPCVIFAGNYVPVDLTTFLQLMKCTYSAFTLLLRIKRVNDGLNS